MEEVCPKVKGAAELDLFKALPKILFVVAAAVAALLVLLLFDPKAKVLFELLADKLPNVEVLLALAVLFVFVTVPNMDLEASRLLLLLLPKANGFGVSFVLA